MENKSGGNRIVMIMAVWTVSAILGLTVAVLAVGWLGLWVAVGAIGAFGTTIVSGVIGQFLFATDFDAMIEERRGGAGDSTPQA
jgi:hypothetical protein